jgi:ABC-type dipeptide/oligopeptide/nickel transport system ATPase component
MSKTNIILSLTNTSFTFVESGFHINNLNIEIEKGGFIGLVGESGSGKSTIGKVLACLYNHKESSGLKIEKGTLEYYGNDSFKGTNLFNCSYNQLVPFRKEVQYLFQNHRAAVHRNMSVKQTMLEAASIKYPELSKKDKIYIIEDMLSEVGLLDGKVKNSKTAPILEKKSRNLSGGQIKRLALGRTLLMNPKVLIADEPLTGLDASRKGRVLKYLTDVWKKRQEAGDPLTILLISHDIGMVLRLTKRVMVIYGDLYSKSSQIVEENLSSGFKLNDDNIHPYTNNLLAATHYFKTGESAQLVENKKRPNNTINDSCKYVSLCPKYVDNCKSSIQTLKQYEKNKSHRIACSVLNP